MTLSPQPGDTTAMAAPYTPFMDPRTARPPGTGPLDPGAWLRVDADYAEQMVERDRLLGAGPCADLWAMLPEAAEAVDELAAFLLGWLARDGRWHVGTDAVRRPDGATVPRAGATLPLMGRLVQEDVLILLAGDAEYRLAAGVLCFPSRWSLDEKLGRPLGAIHGPVPGYAGALAARVNRMFAGLRPDTPLVRVNWLVHPNDTLRQCLREGQALPHDLTRRYHLRTERQCLLRLPHTGAVVFTIKTSLTAVDALSPPERAALADALAGWDAAEIAYRGGVAVWRGALAALGRDDAEDLPLGNDTARH